MSIGSRSLHRVANLKTPQLQLQKLKLKGVDTSLDMWDVCRKGYLCRRLGLAVRLVTMMALSSLTKA